MMDEEDPSSQAEEQADDEIAINGFYREPDHKTNLEDKIEILQQYMVEADPIF
jgi:uncharacterized protein YutD